MVIREHRNALKELLQAMATGRISTWEFLERIENLERSNDPAVVDIIEFAADFDDDLVFSRRRLRGPYRLSKEHRRMVARAILFLKSDRPYEWERDAASLIGFVCGLSAAVELCLSVYFFAIGLAWFFEMPHHWRGRDCLTYGVISAAAGILTIVCLVRRPRFVSQLRPPGDRNVWPYFRTSDCDADRRLPRPS